MYVHIETRSSSDSCSSAICVLVAEYLLTFVEKHGVKKEIKVSIGMNMLEPAHQNDIELEGTKDSIFVSLIRAIVH